MDPIQQPPHSLRLDLAPAGRPLALPMGPFGPGGGERERGEPLGRAQGQDAPLVLLVDDDPGIRQALEMVLNDQGIECLCAGNGAEALELLGSVPVLPSLIILDVMMPVMNGWQFRAAQLADPRLAALPTLLLSAATDAESRARELGLTQTFRKPVDLDALLDAVERSLAQEG